MTMTIPKVPSQVEAVPYIREVTHFSEFFILGFLILKSFGKNYKIFSLGLSYGILTEIIQIFIPGRLFDFYDIALNLSGFLLGFFLLWILHINNHTD
ncbi:MAG: VanZ family protein [Candidatus Aenigmarchaeota archaeon]|nr:VanZ family protein [Candidatus Aenigmarchaeota archaeon]